MMKALKLGLAAAVIAVGVAAGGASAAPADAGLPSGDLIRDHPGVLGTVANGLVAAGGWTWKMVGSGLSFVSPPSASELSADADSKDNSELFKLLSYAGYKLKEIETAVGIIPTVSFKFALVRELSEADWDYLDSRIDTSKLRKPGMYGEAQRAIIGTVMSINNGAAYQVSELKLQALPLPKVQFDVTPKITALSEDASALMRAIQRIERRMRGDARAVPEKHVAPAAATDSAAAAKAPVKSAVAFQDWMVWGAIGLVVLGLLVDLGRLVGRSRSASPVFSYVLFAGGAGLWAVAAYLAHAVVFAAGGAAAFAVAVGVIALRLRDRSDANAQAALPVDGSAGGEVKAVTATVEANAGTPVLAD